MKTPPVTDLPSPEEASASILPATSQAGDLSDSDSNHDLPSGFAFAPLPVRSRRKASITSVAPPRFQPWDTDSDKAKPSPAPAQAGAPQEAEHLSRKAEVNRRVLLIGIIAFVVAEIGESQLFSESSRPVGAALLGVAMLLGILAWGRTLDTPLALARRDGKWWNIKRNYTLALRLSGITIGALLAVLSVVVEIRDPLAIFGLQGVLWLLSMAVLLISCARWYQRDSAATPVQLRWTRVEIVVFVGIVALSLITHLAFLDSLPWRFSFDEGFAYIEAMRFYQGPSISLFTTTWVNTTLPSLWFIVPGTLMHAVGPGLAGVRSGVALVGAITVIPVYLTARLVWGRLAAGLAGFIVAVSAAYIQYSRVSIDNVTTPFAWIICFYFLLKGLRSRRPNDFVWAGLAGGLSMYTYYGTRLLPYVLAAFLVYLLIFHFRAFREHLAHFALLLVAFISGFGPLLGHFILYPGEWTSRALTELNIPLQIPSSWEGWVSDWNILAPLLVRDFLGISVIISRDDTYYGSLLLAPEAAVLALGVGLLIWRWRQPASFLLLMSGLGVILSGGLLVDAATIPNLAHWIPIFPTFYLAMALPVAIWLGALFKSPARILRYTGGLLLVAVLLLDIYGNAYTYLVKVPTLVPPDHSLEAVQARYLQSAGPGTHVYFVGYSWQPLKDQYAQILAPDTPASNLYNPSRELPLVGDPDHNISFVFYNDMYTFGYTNTIQSIYPGGTLTAQRTPANNLIFYSYTVPAAQTMSEYGVFAAFTTIPANEVEWSGRVQSVGAVPTATLHYPLVATWSGQFYSQGGLLKLGIDGMPNATISLMGQALDSSNSATVERGWVPFSVQVRLDKPQTLHLLVQRDGSNTATEPGTASLWPAPTYQGLAVTLGNGAQATHRIDSFVGYNLGHPEGLPDDPGALPLFASTAPTSTVAIEGELNVPASGTYTMNLRTDAWIRLLIDNKPALQLCSDKSSGQNSQVAQPVQLTAGWHALRIEDLGNGNRNGLEWSWTRPDGLTEEVPPADFRLNTDHTTGSVLWPAPPQPFVCSP